MELKNFKWGVATAAYQIEGAADADGKGLSIWDVFSKESSKVSLGDNGDIACRHYEKYKEDIGLIKNLGVNAYRFSISWPRIMPDGFGKVNQKGLDFYSRLTDNLLKNNIEPFATLYHWDMPYELHKKGGWLNRDIAAHFGEYTETVTRALGDRIKNYMTFNEPQCIIEGGYLSGWNAPGYRLSEIETLYATHNLLLSHGYAVRAIRKNAAGSRIGFVSCGNANYPEKNTVQDIEAARKATFDSFGAASLSLYNDPVFLGRYPDSYNKKYPEFYGSISKSDMELISQDIDYCCQNNYEGIPVRAAKSGFEVCKRKTGYATTNTGWALDENGIYWITKFLYERYKKPIMITENGVCCHDWISLDGKVHDPNRIDYLERYLGKIKQAINDGVDIQGYFIWSLMDNFEWASGYSKRFGLVYVDYETMQRTPKDSYYWYKEFLKTNDK